MSFPVTKIAAMLIKRVSKPIAKMIKEKAKTSPFLRNKFLIATGQFYHKNDAALKLKLKGIGRDVEIKPLNEGTAVDITADILGEVILFSILALLLFAEYKRQSYFEQKKERKYEERVLSIETNIKKLSATLKDLVVMMEIIDAYIAAAEAEKEKAEKEKAEAEKDKAEKEKVESVKKIAGSKVIKTSEENSRVVVFRANDSNAYVYKQSLA